MVYFGQKQVHGNYLIWESHKINKNHSATLETNPAKEQSEMAHTNQNNFKKVCN